MHKVIKVLACSPGPPPNVSPYMVPMCVLVGGGGGGLSEPHIYSEANTRFELTIPTCYGPMSGCSSV